MAKLMAPNIRIDWYPEGHFQDIHNPTIAELNSGVNLSCAVVTGYTLDFTDSNTENTTTIFDTHTSEAILNHSYEANLEFFLAPRGTNEKNEEAYRKAEELFYNPENRTGYLAKRFGFPWNQEYDYEHPRQRVDLFKVQADLPKVVSEEGAPILLQVKYIPQGEAASGAMSGTITYEWEGEPHNSPSVKILADHAYSYAWAGDPHGSESIMYKDGVEVARNLFRNPSFENGIEYINSGSVTTASQTNWHRAVAEGSNALRLELEGGGSASRYAQQAIFLPNSSTGYWLGFGLVARLNGSSGVEAQMYLTGAVSDWIDGRWEVPQYDNSSQKRVVRSYYIPPGVGGDLNFWIRFYGSGSNFVETDAWQAVIANTEEEALSLARTYFDGSTPEHTGKLLARNLVYDPRFEGDSDWWDSYGGTRNPPALRGNLFEGLSQSIWVGTANGEDSVNADIWQRHYDMPILPHQYVAIRSLMAATEGSRVRQLAHWSTSSGTQYEGVYRHSSLGGEEYLDVYQAPNDTESLTVRFQANRLDATGDLILFLADVVIAVGDTEEEALAQVRYFFDGDTVDK